ncbi:N-acetyltransferase eco [Galleria mellonella]|uniref:N-acetyltransferase eco n=1 Tax=Galleria mellonella TaxID=7137 RepID=A0ABM3MY79_GALME|nr:N-acetyltransferase eco [Galleria mellonella]
MAGVTPRRSQRLPHMHTPKMSERKKGLFQGNVEPIKESLTEHRCLPVVDSESDGEECDLGIISTLDSSSDENDGPKTPERTIWHETRSQTRKLLKENQDLKNFIKSPFTLKKYQTRYSCGDSKCTGSTSTPATPHFNNKPGTPSSTHSCNSINTTSSTSSRARKSLANLIADTESCSSSLKDLNFDTDSGTDSKENTPTKSSRRMNIKQKMTPKVQSFKGVLLEQKKNMLSPMKTAVVCLTKMDMTSVISPTQMLKTPHNTTETQSPPKLSHNRRSVVEINESPESYGDSEKSQKRMRNDSMSDNAPHSKYPRLESVAPKARTSLFNSERLKEILSAKSFYGKSNPELNSNVTTKISNAIEVTSTHNRRPFLHSYSHKRKRRPGQINLGVRHKIRKPKVNRANITSGVRPLNKSVGTSEVNTTITNVSNNDSSMLSHNSSQELGNDKADPFVKEKETIEALLSQWTEEEVPDSELSHSKPRQELPCFNNSVIEETSQIFQPITAVPVQAALPQDSDAVIVELGSEKETALPQNVKPLPQNVDELPQNAEAHDVVMSEPDTHKNIHGDMSKSGHFLPVEGGYILVADEQQPQDELPDLDEIERELKMLDEQILKMAQSNNINAEAVLASTETAISPVITPPAVGEATKADKTQKLFPIFSNPNPGTPSTSSKAPDKSKKCILKNGSDQYVIDAGQKRFGATQCTECGVIYQVGDPQDEHDHLVHHNATDVLRFNGWKEESVVGTWGGGRCVRVRGGGAGWRRVGALLARLVHPQLGLPPELPSHRLHEYTAYLYIENKQITGCLIVEPKTKAHKLIPGDPDCCSEEEYPIKMGVSRIWTHPSRRRRGVAARLLDCARASLLLGEALQPHHLAFSAPTSAGKALAAKYCGTPNFYIYID